MRKILDNAIALIISGVFLYCGYSILDVGKTADQTSRSVIKIETLLEERNRVERAKDDAAMKIYVDEIHKLHLMLAELEEEIMQLRKDAKIKTPYKSIVSGVEAPKSKDDYEKWIKGRFQDQQQKIMNMEQRTAPPMIPQERR